MLQSMAHTRIQILAMLIQCAGSASSARFIDTTS